MKWEKEGDVLVEHLDFGLKQFDSGAVALNMMHRVLYAWDPMDKQWIDHRGDDYIVYGSYFIINRAGETIDGVVESIVKSLGWDGTTENLNPSSGWSPKHCRVVVKRDEYQGKTNFRGAFLNPYESPPGGSVGGNADVGSLEQRFGSKFRALARQIGGGEGPPTPPPPPDDAPPPDDEDIDF